MNLENLKVQELSLEEQISIEGGGIWSHVKEFIKGFLETI